jgi:hypothetical protein
MLEGKPAAPGGHLVDLAAAHPYTFVWMAVLLFIFGIGRVSRETKPAVTNWKSFLHPWMAAYLVILGILMALTTGMALVLVFDPSTGSARIDWLPPSLCPVAAAALGVLGFEWLFRKFTVGFGESQFDLKDTLQGLVDQAVAATLKKDVQPPKPKDEKPDPDPLAGH